MQDRFRDEDRNARHLLYLVPSVILNNTLELSEETERMLFWEKNFSFPESLENELRNHVAAAKKKIPSSLLLALGAREEDAFPNIHRLLLVGYTLSIRGADAERSFSLT